jgi:hypothetical protein
MASEEKRSALEQLTKRAREDPQFFHDLVFEPERALASADFLERREKSKIIAIEPEAVIAGLAGLFAGEEVLSLCGQTCGDSCGRTCGTGSCGETCGSSCRGTCGGVSCDSTTDIVAARESVILPAEQIERRGIGSFFPRAR